MHPQAFEQLNKAILEQLRIMYISGFTAERMLGLLEVEEDNARLYRFYLEAACGERLEGSIYLSSWNHDNRKHRLEILDHLENHLQAIRNRDALNATEIR